MKAAGSEKDLQAYVESLPELTETADHLYPFEAVTVEDLAVTAGDKIDLATDLTGFTYDEDKVKVHFYQAVDDKGKAFSTEKPGIFTATYYAETLLSHNDYRFTRKVTVKEKDGVEAGTARSTGAASEKGTESSNGTGETGSDEEDGSEQEADPAVHSIDKDKTDPASTETGEEDSHTAAAQ